MLFIPSACIALFIILPVYLITSAILDRESRRKPEREKLKQLAIDRGHVVTAKLIKRITHSYLSPGSAARRDSMGLYEYYYNGKRYKYRFQSDKPKSEMTLYFVDNPRKATVEGALKGKRPPWLLFYTITFAVIYMFMMFMKLQ